MTDPDGHCRTGTCTLHNSPKGSHVTRESVDWIHARLNLCTCRKSTIQVHKVARRALPHVHSPLGARILSTTRVSFGRRRVESVDGTISRRKRPNMGERDPPAVLQEPRHCRLSQPLRIGGTGRISTCACTRLLRM